MSKRCEAMVLLHVVLLYVLLLHMLLLQCSVAAQAPVRKYGRQLMDELCNHPKQLRVRGVEGDAPVLVFGYVHRARCMRA